MLEPIIPSWSVLKIVVKDTTLTWHRTKLNSATIKTFTKGHRPVPSRWYHWSYLGQDGDQRSQGFNMMHGDEKVLSENTDETTQRYIVMAYKSSYKGIKLTQISRRNNVKSGIYWSAWGYSGLNTIQVCWKEKAVQIHLENQKYTERIVRPNYLVASI